MRCYFENIGTLRGCLARHKPLSSPGGCGAFVVSGPFDISRELEIFESAASWGRWGWKAGRHWKASRARKQIEEQYDAETAEAVAAAIASSRNPEPILERAEGRKTEGAEREKLLSNPPSLHGAAAWTTARVLPPFGAFETFTDGYSVF